MLPSPHVTFSWCSLTLTSCYPHLMLPFPVVVWWSSHVAATFFLTHEMSISQMFITKYAQHKKGLWCQTFRITEYDFIQNWAKVLWLPTVWMVMGIHTWTHWRISRWKQWVGQCLMIWCSEWVFSRNILLKKYDTHLKSDDNIWDFWR